MRCSHIGGFEDRDLRDGWLVDDNGRPYSVSNLADIAKHNPSPITLAITRELERGQAWRKFTFEARCVVGLEWFGNWRVGAFRSLIEEAITKVSNTDGTDLMVQCCDRLMTVFTFRGPRGTFRARAGCNGAWFELS